MYQEPPKKVLILAKIPFTTLFNIQIIEKEGVVIINNLKTLYFNTAEQQ